MTMSWADAAADGWICGDIYGYKASDGDYNTPSILDPWYGYWVMAKISGLSLTLLSALGTPVSVTPTAPMAAPRVALPLAAPPLVFAPADLPPMPSDAITLEVMGLIFSNSPNPVTDVNTTYFRVKGATVALVSAIKVEIYDLAGTLVYASGKVAGTSLAWHTGNDYGEYLANGVYSYRMYAKVQGQWVVSNVKSVIILR